MFWIYFMNTLELKTFYVLLCVNNFDAYSCVLWSDKMYINVWIQTQASILLLHYQLYLANSHCLAISPHESREMLFSFLIYFTSISQKVVICRVRLWFTLLAINAKISVLSILLIFSLLSWSIWLALSSVLFKNLSYLCS